MNVVEGVECNAFGQNKIPARPALKELELLVDD